MTNLTGMDVAPNILVAGTRVASTGVPKTAVSAQPAAVSSASAML